jgi:hypothetical protein
MYVLSEPLRPTDCCRVLDQCTVLVSKAFKGQLIIPEFAQFCNDISNIYHR